MGEMGILMLDHPLRVSPSAQKQTCEILVTTAMIKCSCTSRHIQMTYSEPKVVVQKVSTGERSVVVATLLELVAEN